MARRAADQATGNGAEGFVEDGEVSGTPEAAQVPPEVAPAARPGAVAGTETKVEPGPPGPPGPEAPHVPSRPQFAAGSPSPGSPGWVAPAPPPPPPPLPVGARTAPPDRPAPGRLRQPRGPRVVQGRRSRRVIRRIDSWTVFKLSFLFYLCGGLILLIAGVALWNIAGAFDVITNVEKFVQKLFDLQTFKLQAGVIFAYSAVGAGVLVLLGTGANVLMALLYNLISDVIGGVQVIVLEETDADGQISSDRGKGRIRDRADDRFARRRDRPPADDSALSP